MEERSFAMPTARDWIKDNKKFPKLTFLLALFLFENHSRQNTFPKNLFAVAWNRARGMLLSQAHATVQSKNTAE